MGDKPWWLVPALVMIPGAVFAIYSARKTHYYYLDTMVLDEGEALQWEEAVGRVTVKSHAAKRSTLLIGCRIRATDRRLIIAQKGLFSPRHVVQQVCIFRGEVPAQDRAEGAFKSYQNSRVQPESLIVDGEKLTLHVKPELDSPAVYPFELSFKSPNAPRYVDLIRGATT